jgi:high affinity Mn2+ porin
VWQFTDIDESLSLGMQVKGTAWHRPEDTFGLAEVLDAIGHQHQAYLNAGGLGPLIGDSKLPHYGLENVVETYYDVALTKWAHLGFDYQFVANPAYNEDRGPIQVFSARLHLQY